MTTNGIFKWTLYTIGWIAMIIIFLVVWQIFKEAIDEFNKASRNLQAFSALESGSQAGVWSDELSIHVDTTYN